MAGHSCVDLGRGLQYREAGEGASAILEVTTGAKARTVRLLYAALKGRSFTATSGGCGFRQLRGRTVSN